MGATVYITVLDYGSGGVTLLKHTFDDITWEDITDEQVKEWLEEQGEYREDTCYFMTSNFMPDLWNKTGEEWR